MNKSKESKTILHSFSHLKKRSAWFVSMGMCVAFLVMAVRVYDIQMETLLKNLLMILLVAFFVAGFGLLLGWLLTYMKRSK